MNKPSIKIIESHGKTLALEYYGNTAITIWERDYEGWWFLLGTVYISDNNAVAGINMTKRLEEAYNATL